MKRQEQILYEKALQQAKENGSFVIKIDVSALKTKECKILLEAMHSGRLKIEVIDPNSSE